MNTPQTDKIESKWSQQHDGCVPASFARQLEEDNGKLRNEIALIKRNALKAAKLFGGLTMAYRTQLEVSEGLAAVVDMCLGHYLPEGRNPHREAAQAALDEYNAISHTGPELSDSKLDHEATCDVGGRPEAGRSILANDQGHLSHPSKD